jgi:hypothetical protein
VVRRVFKGRVVAVTVQAAVVAVVVKAGRLVAAAYKARVIYK